MLKCKDCEEKIEYKESYKCEVCEERFCEDCLEDDLCNSCFTEAEGEMSLYYL